MEANRKESQRFDLKVWAKILPYLKPHTWRIVFLAVMMLVSAGVDAVVPVFTRHAVNNFVIPRTTEGIGGFVALYLALVLIQTLTTVLYSRQCMILEMDTGRLMKRDCFLHLQRLPLSYYNTTSVGYILARVMSDTNRIGSLIAWGSIHFFWQGFYLLGIIIAMFLLDVKMALIVTSVVPVIFLITLYFQPRILNARRSVRTINSTLTGSINENINGAKTSKTLAIEDRNIQEFEGISSEMYRASVFSEKLSATYVPLITFMGSLAVAMVLFYSGILTANDSLDYGLFSAFIAYGIAILDPIAHIARTFTEFLDAQVNIERMDKLLHEPCTVSDTPEVEALYGDPFSPKTENYAVLHGNVTFDHVWFRYPDAAPDDYVLEDINLTIKAGTTVAIVGETGAGKSTLVNLVCRFFEPTRGRILIDGVDYRERSLHWLHSNIGYVQQTPHLFSGTISENIRYGKPGATQEDVLAAAKLVSADKVAAKLEQGFDTDTGEGGDRLSTGEKQLVSFARAVVANPPIFILDEATASIDTETEQLIQDAISHVLKGRTSFIIAHRLSTIRSADVILFVDARGISEMGTHDELMRAKGQYYRLYTAMMIRGEEKAQGFGSITFGEE